MLTIQFLYCLSIHPPSILSTFYSSQSRKRIHWVQGTGLRTCEAMHIHLPSWGLISRGEDRPLTISPGNECFKRQVEEAV